MNVLRAIALLTISGTLALPVGAQACAVLTPAGEAKREREQQRYLDREADRIVTGTWRKIEDEETLDGDLYTHGYVEVGGGERVTRYRFSIHRVINCGFPYSYVEDGDSGRFFLKRSDFPERRDREDDFVDNYDYVHFEPEDQP